MARIRNIGPRFFEDETMARLPLGGRLLYIGIWTRCDLNGVFEWNVKVLTAALFPHDDGIDAGTVEKWLQALVELGRVTRFEAEGKRYGFLPRFSVHQAISKAERDQDLKNRQAGKAYPVPVTVPKTVPETPDEGQRTKDEGGAPGGAQLPAPLDVESLKTRNRADVAKQLRFVGFNASASSLDEWIDGLRGVGDCGSKEEILEGIRFVSERSKHDGHAVTYFRDAKVYIERFAAFLGKRRRDAEDDNQPTNQSA